MHSRRKFLAISGAFVAASAYSNFVFAKNTQSTACTVFDKTRQADVTPEQALTLLKEGNSRFVHGSTVNCDLMAQVKETSTGQAPFAAIVGCIDSRVPPELVFDQQIGDIFAARIAGNFVNTDIIGSLEFATKLAGAKLIVVLGHSECGAVKGAIDNVKMGNLTATLANIRPSILKITKIEGPQTSKNASFVQAVAIQNAQDAAKLIVSQSDIIRELISSNELKVVSAMHNIKTGEISWLT
jgi:carbonic anhydrase